MEREELIRYIERKDPFSAEKVNLSQLPFTQLVIIKTQVELHLREKKKSAMMKNIKR